MRAVWAGDDFHGQAQPFAHQGEKEKLYQLADQNHRREAHEGMYEVH